MRINLYFCLVLMIGLVAFGTACQNQSPANQNVAANVTNASNQGHDMPDMSAHESNMPNQNMSNMGPMVSAPGAADQPYDLQYIDGMIHHHEGAIQMSNMVLGKTERPELKEFAHKIIDDQTREIAELKQLREQWFSGRPSALNMDLPGMVGGTAMMKSEHMKEMDTMAPEHFDQHFLKMMIAHHEGAVTRSKDALKKAEHPEIKQLAERIIKAQGIEIKQMRKWQSEWTK